MLSTPPASSRTRISILAIYAIYAIYAIVAAHYKTILNPRNLRHHRSSRCWNIHLQSKAKYTITKAHNLSHRLALKQATGQTHYVAIKLKFQQVRLQCGGVVAGAGNQRV